MRRYKQYILVLRETVTSYTRTALIDNERHDTLRNALLIMTSDFKSGNDSGITIRVDAAPAFQSLSKDQILDQQGIRLVIGRLKNMNKNAVVDKAIEELGLEFLKVSPEGGPMTGVTLAQATARMNSRIRHSNLSALEMWTQRDQVTGAQLPLSDQYLIQQQHQLRDKNHQYSAKSKCHGRHGLTIDFKVGDLVYIKAERDKTKSRDKYIIVSIRSPWCSVRKFTTAQFRSRTYDIKLTECYPISSTVLGGALRGPIRGLDPPHSPAHTSDSSSDEEPLPEMDELDQHIPPPAADGPAPGRSVPPAAIVQLPPPQDNFITDPPRDNFITEDAATAKPPRRSSRRAAGPQWLSQDDWVI
jgi:hypothetical protein